MNYKKSHRCENTYDIVNKYFINDISNIIFLYFLPQKKTKKNYKNIKKYFGYSKHSYVISILGIYELCEYIDNPRPLMVGGILGNNPEIFNLGIKLINERDTCEYREDMIQLCDVYKIISFCEKIILEYDRDVNVFNFSNLILSNFYSSNNINAIAE
jgi:hypothetical protein